MIRWRMTVYNESSHKFQMRMRIQYRISKDVAEITRIFYDVTMMVPSDFVAHVRAKILTSSHA